MDKLLETRKVQGAAIETFLENNPEWVVKHYSEFEKSKDSGKVVVISKGSETLEPDFFKALLLHQKEKVLLPEGNLTRDDCIHVIESMREAFKDPQSPLWRWKQTYSTGVLEFEASSGEVPAFYRAMGKKEGFLWHQMFFLQARKAHGENKLRNIAVDLTARYNMDVEQGTMDVFIVIADSERELIETLNTITGVTWTLSRDLDLVI